MVRVLVQPGCSLKLRYIFGLVLCTLLLLFAVGAKTAVYRPNQSQVKNLISAKVRQNVLVPFAEAAPVVQAMPLLILTLLLVAAAFRDTREIRIEPSTVAVSSWFWPALAVRPPPSLQML